ncbi:MAG TPA: serine hydrolase [Candidatus Acidoferrales bacterium]|nr:serine hydrolase [Candidatus Acidoferrales bacterium]
MTSIMAPNPMKSLKRFLIGFCSTLLLCAPLAVCAQPFGAPFPSGRGPLADLQRQLALATLRSPWSVGIDIEDLATGFQSGVNVNASMPAASTIKIPVMVEVFRQMELGRIDLHRTLHLMESDKDDGSGDLCYAPDGTAVTVDRLLWMMITDSDNTATNMLIRLVGRTNINRTMERLGLRQTRLTDDIRTDTDAIRYELRTSPHDMVRLLDAMAHRTLIDRWSSGEMISILTGQRHNGLIPEPLPPGTQIAHKTGTLHDTLNDVGIVYLAGEPYAIAVMTTNLPSLDVGRSFIRGVSLLTYETFERFEHWRVTYGIPGFHISHQIIEARMSTAPDLSVWASHPEAAAAPDEGLADTTSVSTEGRSAPESGAPQQP